MHNRFILKLLAFAVAFGLIAAPALAQERFSLFVPTPHHDVVRVVEAADLREGDVFMDLGSGDGRIVFEAARRHPGIRGIGIEIDEKLVKESNEKAKAEGLADRVQFLHQNVFDADLSQATVINMWLFPELMRMLRPKILREARPGTRVTTRTWNLGSWAPDATFGGDVYRWIVPAKVAGYWAWELPVGGSTRGYAAIVEQHFQNVEGAVRVAHRRELLDSMKLAGDEISFALDIRINGVGLVNHRFQGRVRGDTIEGSVTVKPEQPENAKPQELAWRAKRVQESFFFAPTGTDIEIP
jgi:hypothetical protein